MNDFRSLLAYQKGFKLAMEIFKITTNFPKEEKYSLSDQIKRSSRSVCACIGEAYRKRQYPAHFVSKLSDSDMENTETQVWLDFSLSCKYIDKIQYEDLKQKSEEVGRLIAYMIGHPEKFTKKSI
jgi:four helix bundle protein